MAKRRVTDWLLVVFRLIIVFLAISLFIPSLNPAKISALINKNTSLFTSGFSYPNMAHGFKRALSKGWVSQGSLNWLYFSSLTVCLGIIVSAIGGCLTLGELKMKKLSVRFVAIGTLVSIMGSIGIRYAYNGFTQSSNLDKVGPYIPYGWQLLLVILFISFFISVLIHMLLRKEKVIEDKLVMKPKYYLFLLIMPFVALCFVFSYLPLWGWRYSFFNYKPGFDLTMDNYAGLKWYTYLFENKATRDDILRVIKNTLAMSGLGIATSWFSMAFAIFLNEIKASKFRRLVQTLTTIPNFISWVLVYAFAFALFATDGFVNQIMIQLGIFDEAVNFLTDPNHIWLKMLAWGIWKGLGWGAIIYLAAISGIEQQLYEAATVDGAGRFKRMWYITVPGLLPTYFVLLMLSIAGILSNGMDQYLVFKNAANKESIEVLDLYVYTLGLGTGASGNIPLATAVSMLKSIISVTLLFFANGLSKLIRKESII